MIPLLAPHVSVVAVSRFSCDCLTISFARVRWALLASFSSSYHTLIKLLCCLNKTVSCLCQVHERDTVSKLTTLIASKLFDTDVSADECVGSALCARCRHRCDRICSASTEWSCTGCMNTADQRDERWWCEGCGAEWCLTCPEVHEQNSCDGCNTQPIHGPRFSSTLENEDLFDLCQTCYNKLDAAAQSELQQIHLPEPPALELWFGDCRLGASSELSWYGICNEAVIKVWSVVCWDVLSVDAVGCRGCVVY